MPQYSDFPQGEFEPELFDMLLNGPLTYRVSRRAARLCPCDDGRSGGPAYDCPVCQGRGYIWSTVPTVEYEDTLTHYGTGLNLEWRFSFKIVDERLSRARVTEILEVRDQYGGTYSDVSVGKESAIIWGSRRPQPGTLYTVRYRAPEQMRLHAQGIRTQRSWAARGEVKEGDMECSIPERLEDLITPNPAFQAKEHDRFVFLDLERPVNQRMTRGSRETLLYPTFWEIKAARAIVGGSEVTYEPGVDFVINNNAVQWLTSGPPYGSPYVLDYIACPEYYVFAELPQMRHVDGLRLPRRVGLRLFDLYPGRGG